MKKPLTQKELVEAKKDFAHFQEKVEKETQIKKNELTIDAIDTLIFNNFWGDDLPMVGHVKDEGYFLLKFSAGDNFVSLERKVGETVYVLEMKTSVTDSRVIFHPGSAPFITTPDMTINGIFQMVSHIFKNAKS
ncbi:hypothetical protein [Thiolapillus sp.]|uniref:hypothetical protein n=1 Tax=Thiolapillus sp. TaxID=2017437 RepID=UPI003AF71D83